MPDLGVDEIFPDVSQPRKTLLPEELKRLTASIAARGILQPIRVRWDDARQRWQIISGESRWRAARMAGLTHVPCVAMEGEATEVDILGDQLVENSIRSDLRPLELARGIRKLKALSGCNSQTLTNAYGLSGPAITRAESLLTLPEDIQEMVDSGVVPESAAYHLSRLPDEQTQREMANAIAAGKLTRDQVADAVRNRLGKKPPKAKGSRLSAKLDGLSIIVSAGKQRLTWPVVNAALERLQAEAKRHQERGTDIATLRTLRTS